MTNDNASPPADSLAAWLALWPTYKDLALAMGVPVQSARYWVVRGRIPPRYWPRFIAVMQDRFGVTPTAEHLAAPYQDTSREVA